MLIDYQDPKHEANSAKYHTGKQCANKGCSNPAGTFFNSKICFPCNKQRMENIKSGIKDILDRRGKRSAKE